MTRGAAGEPPLDAPSSHSFLDYYRGIRARTRRVIDCIPATRFDWSPDPERWTFADLVRHLAAIERWLFAENAAGRPCRYPGHGRELADGPEAVLAYLDRLHGETLEILGRLDEAAMARKCETPGGVAITTWKWLRAMVEHEVHHRGQIYLMLGLLGVETPPLYGLTSEQVRERSLPPVAPGPQAPEPAPVAPAPAPETAPGASAADDLRPRDRAPDSDA